MKVPHFCKFEKAVTLRKQIFQKRHPNCLIFQSPPVVSIISIIGQSAIIPPADYITHLDERKYQHSVDP